MDILFEIFQLKEPDWTDDFHLALLSVGKIKLIKVTQATVWYMTNKILLNDI